MDLTATLNILSTLTLIAALIFAALQVRAANRTRAEQAALAIVGAVQSEAWTASLRLLVRLPPGVTPDEIDHMDPRVAEAIAEHGVRLETVGYMVFRGLVSLETVDEMIGGITLVMWSRIKPWVERDRVRTTSPRQYEWLQWLCERLQERHRTTPVEPAFFRHAGWKEADAHTSM